MFWPFTVLLGHTLPNHTHGQGIHDHRMSLCRHPELSNLEIGNGILEDYNSKLQAFKPKAEDINGSMLTVYMLYGKLDFPSIALC